MNLPVIRVLLAEDDPNDAELTLERLARAGFHVESIVVNNAADFSAALDGGNLDLVLSDCRMPGFSGITALRLTRSHPSSLPFIFVSAEQGEEHAVDMLKEGAADYVLKQRLDRLPGAVRRALDEVRAREEAQRQQRNEASLAKRFLATLPDDLRAPLGPIYDEAGALLAQRAGLPPEVLRGLERIRLHVEIEARLIDDLRNVSAIVSGNPEMRPEPTDLAAVLAGVADVFRAAAARRDIALRYVPPPGAIFLLADPAKLQRIFWNLLKNAVAVTRRGGAIEIRIRRPAPGKIAVDVTDTGSGIPPQELERLAEVFAQQDGHGVRGDLEQGLAVASWLAWNHGGRLSAHSSGQDEGATLTVTLNDPIGEAA